MQRLWYEAVFECRECHSRVTHPRGFMWYFADVTRCPHCGTERLRRISRPDHIDRMFWNFYYPLRFMSGLRLYHCRFCRIQFYDKERAKSQLHK